MECVSEEDKQEPKWQFGLKEAEGRKHRNVRVVEGKKVLLHNLRFEDLLHQSARSVSWADVSSRKSKQKCKAPLERQVHGRHYPQRSVDVEKVRTLIWCRKCADWASENRLGKRLRDVSKPGDARLSYQL